MKLINFNLLMMLYTIAVLNSCARVAIVDSPWWSLRGERGARESWLRSSEKNKTITKAEWDAIAYGKICTTPETFLNWKVALQKLCGDSKGACYFYKEEVKAIEKALDNIQGK